MNRDRGDPPLRVLRHQDMGAVLRKGDSARVNKDILPRFRVGDQVLTRNMHPRGHTRLPRYARARRGVVVMDHGVFVFPDTHAASGDPSPQHCYAVRFSMRELWGDDASATDCVSLDLFDDYLDAAQQIAELPALPRDREGPVFAEPWQAQAFALAQSLGEDGVFTWSEWCSALNVEILAAQAGGDPDLGNTYYQHWLRALERLVTDKGLLRSEDILRRHQAWERAHRATPHGEPVLLARAARGLAPVPDTDNGDTP